MSRLRKTRREKIRDEVQKEAEVDMTPMIDVVFLLIIFFLCIDFKILEAKLPAYLPKDKGSQDTKVEPQEQLRIKIVCTEPGQKIDRPGQQLRDPDKRSKYVVGHVVHYTVGPKKVETLDELKEELKAIHDDDNRKVPDPKNPGKTKLIGIVIEPGFNVVYGDVAPCVDAITDENFTDINFGGGLGAAKSGSSDAAKARAKAKAKK